MKLGNVHYKGKATEAGEALLLDYATGSLNEALSLVVSTHLSMSSSSRDFVKQCETIGGNLLLGDCAPIDVSSHCLESVLAQLDTRGENRHNQIYENAPQYELDGMCIPSPLSNVLSSQACSAKSWHKIVKGIESFDLLRCDTSHAQLLRMAPATTAPAHSHAGLEVTLILDGAFSDETGEYHVGDLIVEDETTIHAPVSCPRQGCVCLAVTTAPIRLTGWMGRLINPFLR